MAETEPRATETMRLPPIGRRTSVEGHRRDTLVCYEEHNVEDENSEMVKFVKMQVNRAKQIAEKMSIKAAAASAELSVARRTIQALQNALATAESYPCESQYMFVQPIGEGASSEVWLGRCPKNNPVAIKVITKNSPGLAEESKRVVAEKNIMQELPQCNFIITLHVTSTLTCTSFS